MKLAKPRIDVGLYTNRRDEMLAFWRDEVGLPYEELLPMGGGVQQHRFGLNGSVLKVNHSRDPIPDAAARRLSRARDRAAGARGAARRSSDPDGNRVRLVPPGHESVSGLGAGAGGARPRGVPRLLRQGARARARGRRTRSAAATRCCASRAIPPRAPVGRMTGPGYRYFTVQVFEVDREHAGILARGGAEGRAPLTLGKVARISFVRDPDGNWIEISQRASLTGPLPKE